MALNWFTELGRWKGREMSSCRVTHVGLRPNCTSELLSSNVFSQQEKEITEQAFPRICRVPSLAPALSREQEGKQTWSSPSDSWPWRCRVNRGYRRATYASLLFHRARRLSLPWDQSDWYHHTTVYKHLHHPREMKTDWWRNMPRGQQRQQCIQHPLQKPADLSAAQSGTWGCREHTWELSTSWHLPPGRSHFTAQNASIPEASDCHWVSVQTRQDL